MLAAANLPPATAYSVAEPCGHAGKLDGKLKTEPIFYGTSSASPRPLRSS